MDVPERSAADVRAKLNALEMEHDRLSRLYEQMQVQDAVSAPVAVRLEAGWCGDCGEPTSGSGICDDCAERRR